mmetsp:Transcript_95065/g.297283  ORF Transcript_95065/g.297283 Transcript_95065/m.297283 type:complete len:314 (+) Transcript_95065:176-1117(+)
MWGMGMPMTPAPVAAGCGGGRPALAMVTGDPSQPPPPAGPAPWAPAGPATPGGMGAPTMAAPTMMFQQAAAMPGITQGPHPMASMPSAQRTELAQDLDRFIANSSIDSRAMASLRAQEPEVQRAVLERGELTDCQNPSTALMGRIRVAHENLAFERKRALTPGGPGDAAAGAVKEPPAASQEVEDFIRENKIDGLAARQLREADQETQEDVVARGSLSDCRNPSAVCLARIRDSKSMAMARLESNKSAEPAKPSSGTSSQNTTVANMMVPMVSMPMGNPMMMMANMQASMGGMMPMAGMMPMGNMMMGGMGGM